MSKCIGIDFINTNPRIAVLEIGKPVIIFNGQGGVTPDSSEAVFTQRLKQLKAIAEGYLEQTVTHAGIAVPYFFNTLQRQTLVRAAKHAGFQNVSLTTESVAAALTACLDSQAKYILVCSEYGNTFSVSAFEYGDDVLDELACADKDWQEENNEHLAKKTIHKIMGEAELNFKDLYGVLLTRGLAHIPELRNLIVNRLGLELIRDVPPDDCIVHGAALRAGIRTGELRSNLVLDLLPLPLRVEMPDGTLTGLFSDDCPTLPAGDHIDYSWDSSHNGEVRVFHGKQMVERFDLKTVFPVQRDKQPVKLYFDLDLEGILTISFQDPTDKNKKISINRQAGSPVLSPTKADTSNHTAEIIRSFLPVYDNLERAMRQDTADTAYKKGVEMTMNQLKGVLAKLGITEIDALGKPFDPNFHNAVMHIEDGSFGKNIVSQVFQTGFMIGNKVVRFAAVQVAN